jgi:tRNA threonylcarbamoyladenosine modification (KEOPS) complex  Pcc1 subunit
MEQTSKQFAYTGVVKIHVLSDNELLIRSLPGTIDAALSPTVGSPSYVPGAVGSWWQLLVDIGVINLPLGVVGNLIASWIWEAKNNAAASQITTLNLSKPSRVKLVLSDHGNPVEVEIESDDLEAIRASVEAALRHVDQQQ